MNRLKRRKEAKEMEQTIKKNNFSNAYQEVYIILQDLNREEYNKIPLEIIKTLDRKRNKEYIYELDDDLELKDHEMLFATKAILFNIFRDYLATPERKEEIIKLQNEARRQNEIKKQQMYNPDVFANRRKEHIKNQKEEPKIVEYKENLFKKIVNKITKFFRKN